MAAPQPQPVLKRGMRVCKSGSNSICSVGPLLVVTQQLRYFFTVQHGISPVGERYVDATLTGNSYVTVGQYITGVRDEKCDWALVQLNNTVKIDLELPAFQAKATGLGFNYQKQPPQYQFFTSDTAFQNCRKDLDGNVEGSPTCKDQYQFITQPGTNEAKEGDSGMAVYSQAGELLGMEWGIYVDRTPQGHGHLFYVQPIDTVIASLLDKIQDLKQRNQAAIKGGWTVPGAWTLIKPLADILDQMSPQDAHHHLRLNLF